MATANVASPIAVMEFRLFTVLSPPNLYYSLLLSCIKLKVLKGGAAITIRLKGMKR
jgi:hypothetical protein